MLRIRLPFAIPGSRWAQDFRYHLAEWCYEDEWDTGRKPGRLRRLRLAAELLWRRATTPLSCWAFGHDYEDHDPGDPEVGPDPDVYCNRCGRR